jgi:hypothetical protein
MGNAAPGDGKAAILSTATDNKNQYIFAKHITEIDE